MNEHIVQFFAVVQNNLLVCVLCELFVEACDFNSPANSAANPYPMNWMQVSTAPSRTEQPVCAGSWCNIGYSPVQTEEEIREKQITKLINTTIVFTPSTCNDFYTGKKVQRSYEDYDPDRIVSEHPESHQAYSYMK